MFSWIELDHIVAWSAGKPQGRMPKGVRVSALSTDTRDLKKGEVFLALKGDNFDGHNFIPEAIKKGAGAILAEKSVEADIPVIVVKDSLSALVKIAEKVRDHFQGKVIGITGSAGKSSTKEMTATLLGDRTVRSPASFNNLIGVSKTVLLLNDTTQFLVLEMGMNAVGEIKTLCEHFHPHIGLITNIGDAHIGKLGGKKGIYRAKKELFDYLAAATPHSLGIALNIEDPLVKEAYEKATGGKIKAITYASEGTNADVSIIEKFIDPVSGLLSLKIEIMGEKVAYNFPIFGLHHAQNLAAAIAVALLLDVRVRDMKTRFAQIKPATHRGEVLALGKDCIVIDESYNSNPTALTSSLDSLAKLDPTRRRLLILGDMRELGEFSKNLHRQAGEQLAKQLRDLRLKFALLAVGSEIEATLDPIRKAFPQAPLHQVSHVKEAIAVIDQWMKPSDILFVKGSHGVRLDLLVDHLLTHFPAKRG